MEANDLMQQFESNGRRIEALAQDVSAEKARWKPTPESWSILEVINHLLDEEKQDFRLRLDLILHQPEEEWPGIDPEVWVIERKYNQKNLADSLDGFREERRVSLEWLKSLGSVDWDAAHVSQSGTMRAGDMFASWVTHDELHMRQLVELHRAYTEFQAQPYSIEYAGPW